MLIKPKGKTISKGYAKRDAPVCRQPIGFNFGLDLEPGFITEYNHELFGKSIKDKMLTWAPREVWGILCGLPIGQAQDGAHGND